MGDLIFCMSFHYFFLIIISSMLKKIRKAKQLRLLCSNKNENKHLEYVNSSCIFNIDLRS